MGNGAQWGYALGRPGIHTRWLISSSFRHKPLQLCVRSLPGVNIICWQVIPDNQEWSANCSITLHDMSIWRWFDQARCTKAGLQEGGERRSTPPSRLGITATHLAADVVQILLHRAQLPPCLVEVPLQANVEVVRRSLALHHRSKLRLKRVQLRLQVVSRGL